MSNKMIYTASITKHDGTVFSIMSTNLSELGNILALISFHDSIKYPTITIYDENKKVVGYVNTKGYTELLAEGY